MAPIKKKRFPIYVVHSVTSPLDNTQFINTPTDYTQFHEGTFMMSINLQHDASCWRFIDIES